MGRACRLGLERPLKKQNVACMVAGGHERERWVQSMADSRGRWASGMWVYSLQYAVSEMRTRVTHESWAGSTQRQGGQCGVDLHKAVPPVWETRREQEEIGPHPVGHGSHPDFKGLGGDRTVNFEGPVGIQCRAMNDGVGGLCVEGPCGLSELSDGCLTYD